MRLLRVMFLLTWMTGLAVSQVSPAQTPTVVPEVLRYTGQLPNTNGIRTQELLRFAIYAEQASTSPLWSEEQVVWINSNGSFNVLLGTATENGVPARLFAAGAARWIGVSVDGREAVARSLMVSVPYALKAADAETLGGLPPSSYVTRQELANTSAAGGALTGAYINTAAVNAAVNSAVTAAITVSSPTLGYVPYFYDASGDLKNSSLFQATSGFVGVGTTTPAALLTLVGINPTMRIENYSNVTGDSPNFNFYTGRGTSTAPLATLSGDNLGQFASAGYNGSAFPGSKVKVSFLSTENWTATANGTAMAFATTKNGTTARTERLRIDNTGNVGIGTTTPGYPLSVAGVIQSTSGGFKFPDGSTQATAATGGGAGVTLTSPDSSITVGGTSPALTVEANSAVVQKRVTGTCAAGTAVTAVSATGTVSCASAGGGTSGGGLIVKDAKGNALGTMIAMAGTDVTIYTSGYFVTVGISGEFPVATAPFLISLNGIYPGYSEILWSDASCGGSGSATAYLDTQGIATTNFPTMYAKDVIYSASTNQLMLPVVTAGQVTATSATFTLSSVEYAGYNSPDYTFADGVSWCYVPGGTASETGWQLAPINPATVLGWTVSGTPLQVAGPLQLP